MYSLFVLVLLFASLTPSPAKRADQECPTCPDLISWERGSLGLADQDLCRGSIYCGYVNVNDPKDQTYCIFDPEGIIEDNGGGDGLCPPMTKVTERACDTKSVC